MCTLGITARMPAAPSTDTSSCASCNQVQDVRVPEVGGGLDLAQEPPGPNRGCELRLQRLDRDLATMYQILGEIDDGHAAGAKLAFDAIAVGQRQRQRFEVIGRSSENRSSASAFVRPQIEALATRGHDCIPAAQSSRCKGNRLRRSSCLRARGWRSKIDNT